MHPYKNQTCAVLVMAAMIASGCVRNRKVEDKKDFDGNRISKSVFANGKEWLGAVTVVNNGSNGSFGNVGLQSETTIGHFNITKDKLQYIASDNFVNAQTGEPKTINEWAITHSEYQQKESGGRVSNVVTENEDISWKDKKFMKVDWSASTLSELAAFPWNFDTACWDKKGATVDPDTIDIADDHINFIVSVTYEMNTTKNRCWKNESYVRNLTSNTVKFKYSFMPDFKSDYVPYVYTGETDPLMKKYGYFNTTATTVDEFRRAKNTFLMNRWNPTKTHTFYIAPGTPEEFRWILNDPNQGIIARTNQLFESKNLPIRFEVKDADKDHQFGDIRYSFFNIMDDYDDDAPFGLGPSVAHPRTGEIISANVNVWTAMLKYYVKRIRDHVERADNFDQKSSLFTKINEILDTKSSSEWTEATSSFLNTTDAGQAFLYAIPDYTFGRQGNLFSADYQGNDSEFKKVDVSLLSASTRQGEGFQKLDQIENSAMETEQSLAAASPAVQLKRAQIRYLDSQSLVGLEKIAPSITDDELVQDIMYRVVLHEFGHNMNLRHNFYGSVEAAMNRNQKTEKYGLPVGTASIMDYLDLKDEIDQARDWEAYDKAALLFAYSGGAIDEVKETGKLHLFCTDEHLLSNPLCNQFDSGATPSEVLKSQIASYDDNFSRRNFRDGRAFWDAGAYASSAYRTMMMPKKFLNLKNQAYEEADLTRILASRTDISADAKAAFVSGIQADKKQAVKLAMAFYSAVISQSRNERSFEDTYETWNGGLAYKGIYEDKVFAAQFLLGSSGLPFNPNEGPYLTSFAQLIEDNSAGKDLQDFAKKVIAKTFVDTGDGYVGFSTMVRVFGIYGTQFQKGSDVSYQAGRLGCYTADSLAARFGIHSLAFTANAPLVTITDATQITDPYYKTQSKVAVRQINGVYYTAGEDSNFLAYALLTKDSFSSSDEADTRELHNFFSSYSEGRAAECQ